MADGISVVFKGIPEAKREFARINRSMDRATMYAVRQAGRKVKQYSRKAAPVYKGPPRNRWFHKQVVGPMGRGDLKNSISSSKRLKRYGKDGWAVDVAPHGWANLYASRQEQRQPYMAPAVARVEAEMPEIARKAWESASKSRR